METIKLFVEIEGGMIRSITTDSDLKILIAIKDNDMLDNGHITVPEIDAEYTNNTFNDIYYHS